MMVKRKREDTGSDDARVNKVRVLELGRGSGSENQLQSPLDTSWDSRAGPSTATAQGSPTQPDHGASPPQAGTTVVGNNSQRIRRRRWTSQMNEVIMREYYTITKLETQTTAYRQPLHAAFTRAFPDIHVTEQRVADQRRTIINNKLLSNTTLQNIKQQVAQTLRHEQTPPQDTEQHDGTTEQTPTDTPHDTQQQTPTRDTQQHTTTPDTQQHTSHDTQQSTPQDTAPDEHQDRTLTQTLQNTFEEFRTKYHGTDPTQRPGIPKVHTNRHVAKLIHIMNTHILPQNIHEHTSLQELHFLIYTAALTITTTLGLKHYTNTAPKTKTQQHKPHWQTRLESSIHNIRQQLGWLTQYTKQNITPKLKKHLRTLFRKLKTHTKHERHNQHITEYMDTLRQKLAAKSQRLKRYKTCTLRKQQNTQFTHKQKTFYSSLNNNTNQTTNTGAPTTDALQHYWSSLWSNAVEHNREAAWIKEEEQNTHALPRMTYQKITKQELTQVIRNTHNWKAPGVDKIQNFWYKRFTCTHGSLAEQITNTIQNPNTIPPFLTQGITYLKPKSQNTADPTQYRPITCLPTLYKIITACITNKIYQHIEDNHILAEQQKGCRKGHMGCKEQLLIDAVVLGQTHKKHRNLHAAYIDYKKAFDSVPHTWLLHTLNIYKIHPTLITFLHNTMKHWSTTLHLTLDNTNITTGPIHIRRGIFQGDSLSPLWFCLALNPLSALLNNTQYGYNIRHATQTHYNLTHLLYMDDIKLYASTRTHLNHLLKITETFTTDINMQFGLDKCKTLHIHKGKLQGGSFSLRDGGSIASIVDGEVYKYLGFQQAKLTDHKHIKTTLTKQFTQRLTSILKSHLNARNTITAINTYAIPLLTYSFGVVPWTQTDLERLQTRITTKLTSHRCHHPNAATERLTLPRIEGGRGIIDLTQLYHKQVHSLKKFFHDKAQTSALHKAVQLADKHLTPLNLRNTDLTPPPTTTTTKQHKHTTWLGKALHGRHPNELNQAHVDKEASNYWLREGSLFTETEGFMLAIQDQVIPTNNYRLHILKQQTDGRCRKCNTEQETIQHITSGCKMLTQTDYLHRHNQVTNIIHQHLATQHGLLTTKTPYYKYTPDSVMENTTHKLYYDRSIITDKTIHHNRPDITLVDKHNKTTYIIDITIPNTHNLQDAHTSKLNKYTALAIEVKRLWKMDKVCIVPIVLSTTGVIPNTLHDSLSTLKLSPHIYKTLQKATIINTCHIVRKFITTNT